MLHFLLLHSFFYLRFSFNMKGIFGSGTNDFLLLRFSSLVLLLYFVYLTFFIWSNAPLTFDLWKGLFSSIFMKAFTSLFLISFGIHTWIGTWAIGSDYLTEARLGVIAPLINKFYRVLCSFIIGSVILWSLLIIW